MDNWRRQFKVDPLPPLLASDNAAVEYFAQRDLLGERAGPASQLWQLPGARKILKKQQADGAWPRPGEHKHSAIYYALIETWRWFRCLVDQYGFTREHPQARQAAEFLFSCQTDAGDFRGILANQYATYYTGAILSLLIKAGYEKDPRVERAFQWLLAMRQDDQKHGGVHGAFGEHYVKTGLFDTKYHRWLLAAFNRRIVGDYGVEVDFTSAEAQEIIRQAQEFLQAAKDYLE